MEEKIIVTKSDYIISAVSKKQYPEEKFPEIVFVGRSNVGKSSLINSLTRRRNLARTSQTPGKTQTINFYKVELKISAEETFYKNFYLVDLPGYGYAKTSKTNRATWAKFIEEYLSNSREIKFVCQLVDMRHAPMESDLTRARRRHKIRQTQQKRTEKKSRRNKKIFRNRRTPRTAVLVNKK